MTNMNNLDPRLQLSSSIEPPPVTPDDTHETPVRPDESADDGKLARPQAPAARALWLGFFLLAALVVAGAVAWGTLLHGGETPLTSPKAPATETR